MKELQLRKIQMEEMLDLDQVANTIVVVNKILIASVVMDIVAQQMDVIV